MQKVLTNNPDPTQAADAKKFLALTALDGNPKELIAAEAEVQKELKSNPDYVPALMAQAALLAQRGQAKPATETLHRHLAPAARFRACAETPCRACMLKTRPQSLPRTTSPRKRVRHCQTIPSYAELLGRLSYEKKEYPRAIQLFQESARKRPLDAEFSLLSGNVSAPGQAN